jgi:hypothetical protein
MTEQGCALLYQLTGSGVLESKVLVGELGSVDGLAAGAVVVREVAALCKRGHSQGDQIWPNFRLFGNCLMAVLLKMTELAKLFGLLFPQ